MSYGRGISNDTQSRKLLMPWMVFPSVFSPAELTTIENHCKSLPLISGGSPDGVDPAEDAESKFRISNVGFHYPNDPKLKFVFEKFNNVFEYVNSNFYNFDIDGYDYFQYAEYDAKESGQYNWHIDLNVGASSTDGSTRKLSMSMLLNTPGVDFEGGDFSTFISKELNVPLKRGQILIFPSFIVHRVKPVTKGIRKSLVIWVTGPRFK